MSDAQLAADVAVLKSRVEKVEHDLSQLDDTVTEHGQELVRQDQQMTGIEATVTRIDGAMEKVGTLMQATHDRAVRLDERIAMTFKAMAGLAVLAGIAISLWQALA